MTTRQLGLATAGLLAGLALHEALDAGPRRFSSTRAQERERRAAEFRGFQSRAAHATRSAAKAVGQALQGMAAMSKRTPAASYATVALSTAVAAIVPPLRNHSPRRQAPAVAAHDSAPSVSTPAIQILDMRAPANSATQIFARTSSAAGPPQNRERAPDLRVHNKELDRLRARLVRWKDQDGDPVRIRALEKAIAALVEAAPGRS